MEREIILKIPDEIIEEFNKEKNKIEKIEFCGKYATSRLEDGLKKGAIAKINDDLNYILKVSHEEDDMTNSTFVTSYYTYLNNVLTDILNFHGIKIDSDRKKEDMLIALKKCQIVLTKFNEENDINVLKEKVLKSFEKNNPHRFYRDNEIEATCDFFLNWGLGKIEVIDEQSLIKGDNNDLIRRQKSKRRNPKNN